MWRVSTFARSQAGCFSLEAHAACAGMALACAYSGSDEYEASVIAARRDAGAYGYNHRHLLLSAAAAAATLVLIIAF